MTKTIPNSGVTVHSEKQNQMITLEYYTSIEQISKEAWTLATSPNDVFLQYDYLSFLEKFPPTGLSFAYVIYYNDCQPVGIAYFQISGFDVAKSLSGYFSKGKLPAFSESLAKSLNFNSLVSGNLLLTGEHGFYFKPVVDSQRQQLMMKAIRTVRARIKKEGRGATLNFVKDYHLEQDQFLKKQCGEFDFHPNMILDIHNDWTTFEDYLNSMTTKYRTRAKRALKKLEPVKLVKLSLQDMEVLNARIYHLYTRIAKNVGFNLVELHPNYFLEIKRIFGAKYEIWGAFDGEQLIGFYTTMHNYDELETGFLGFDDSYNPTHQLYLNFLYGMVKQGIEKRVSRIVFARTAMEIKSSIGAEPVKMHTYIKHQSKVVNAMLPHLVKWLSPPQDWVQRKPFKHQAEE